MQDFDRIAAAALKEYPILEAIVTYKIDGYKNVDIKDKLIKEREDSAMQNNEDQYCLIVTTVLEGYSENVMNAAKKGGATGGTIINGRSLGKGGSHFLKMNIEPEKDVILIVAKEIDRMNIMTEITNKTGIKKKLKGYVLVFL